MPYLQITTRCNMTCAHCMFSCTAKGEDMPLETVRAAVKMVRKSASSDNLFLGGGEPTLHPQFWEIVGLLMFANAGWSDDVGCPPVGLVTNGSKTETALTLATLARNGFIACSLSRDRYHGPIDHRVVEAFERNSRSGYGRDENGRDARDIRNVQCVRAVGRGRNVAGAGSGWIGPGCGACDTLITPDGKVWRCSCRKEELGSVWVPPVLEDGLCLNELGCSQTGPKLVNRGVCRWTTEEAMKEGVA